MKNGYSTQPVYYVREESAPPPPRRRGCLGRFLLTSLLLLAVVIFGAVAFAGALVYLQLSREIEEGIAALDAARNRESFETTRILDRDGELLWEIFGEGRRTKAPLAEIPVHLRQATVAVEDDTFFENNGLDAPSLLAALVYNLRNPEERPVGGSTITQQIVRHIVFDYDERTAVSYSRKAREIILAWLMNRNYSKEEILELYLNEIYYGNLAYGVEAAAETYFGKSARALTLAEASLLAALPQSPVELDPLTNLEGARERQWLVLNLMVEEGYITPEQRDSTWQEPLAFAPQEVNLSAPHFAVYVRQLLETQFGSEMVANGGLRVTTTLDMDYQRLAEKLAREHVAKVGIQHNLSNAALVALKPGTGEILAMVGSVDYSDETIAGNVNVALSPQQPGSAMKPLTYAAALSPGEDGTQPAWTAGDLLWDVSVDYQQLDGTVYSPVNYSGRFHGPLRLRTALANSYNVPAVILLQDIGVSRLLAFARQMGIDSLADDPDHYGLSLTLGGGEVTPLELTAAYAVFANGGNRLPPTAILRVERTSGELLFEQTALDATAVVDPRVAFIISDILDDDEARAPAMGRDNPLALPFPAAAKTGTTNGFRDNWTVGYTADLAVGVWTGNTDNSEMIEISGLTGAAPLWSDFMQAVYADEALRRVLASAGDPSTPFTPPPGLERRPLCAISTVLPGAEACRFEGEEWFLANDAPAPPTPEPAVPLVTWEQVDPAVWKVTVVPLPAQESDVAVAEDEFPPPNRCYFSRGTPVAQVPSDATVGIFLAPPRNEESRIAAYRWADDHDLAILPRLSCSEEMIARRRGNEVAVWYIQSPKPGDSVGGSIPIIGTADFDPQRVLFFKVELGRGDNPSDWITLGETHAEPVVNGRLETLLASAFEPGAYALRLVVVGRDSNYVGEPHVVNFSIE